MTQWTSITALSELFPLSCLWLFPTSQRSLCVTASRFRTTWMRPSGSHTDITPERRPPKLTSRKVNQAIEINGWAGEKKNARWVSCENRSLLIAFNCAAHPWVKQHSSECWREWPLCAGRHSQRGLREEESFVSHLHAIMMPLEHNCLNQSPAAHVHREPTVSWA